MPERGISMEQKKVKKSKIESTRRWCATHIPPYLYTLPAVSLIVIFVIYPVIDMFSLSLHEWNGFQEKTYVGLKNFDYLFNIQIDFKTALIYNQYKGQEVKM